MAEKQVVKSEELKVEGSAQCQYVTIDNIRIRLAKPLELDTRWVGNTKVYNQLRACWHCHHPKDLPMCPRLVGKPGVGKTMLAYSVGASLELPVFFFQATSDTKPNDVLINPVVAEGGLQEGTQVEYVASTLVTAMITGAVCVFDEGNRMQEKAWASLAPLLDSRRYVESVAVGLVIKAHPNFRYVATMNDDASCFELPEYIKSRLQPQILVDSPNRAEEREILEANLPRVNPLVLDYVADFLDAAHRADEKYTVREGIHIANYAGKLVDYEVSSGRELDPGEAVMSAVEQILGVRQTRYIKQILWKERAA
ncbi:MAG: AAA family ATPase [Deltaproteobacteria bacterium]|nr:AAA family ATPase [Deltaproteobacteria bacterium]